MLDRRNLLDNGFAELIDIMGDDHAIVEAARVSVAGESKGDKADKKLLFYMMEHRHTSPFEQVVLKWRIKTPLFVARQWMRHRTWAYNEVSRRYTSENLEFYMPDEWRLQAKNNRQGSDGLLADSSEISMIYNDCTNQSLVTYQRMIEAGIAREQARVVLPQNMYTMFIGTVNLHNLFGFFRQRADPHAQLEIRVYAEAMKDMLADRLPWSMEAFKEFV